MDVDTYTYRHQLLGILIAISEADFVSFDLELTGIPSRLPGKEPWKPRPNGQRTTLEDRYQETKEAADRYKILQVGLTCAHFDYVTNNYVLRPYNIALSPLLNEDLKLDIEREIHLQSGAATFLLKHGFDFAASLAHGVQYLSREDASGIQKRLNERLEKKPDTPDLQLKDTDVQSLDFVKRVREAIVAWNKTESDMLEITTHTGFSQQPPEQVITRFEKRLVHQLVRAEFPKLVTLSRNECIRIIYYDEMREEENKRRTKRRVKENIAKQTGFRWIFEALAADGDLDQADPYYFGRNTAGYIMSEDSTDTKARFDRAHERLQKHKPVLVGHNMFTDLVYLYRSFVGELPDTLEEFCEALHALFPKIIDTKYLATYAEGDLNASPTLQEIAEKIEHQPLPDIVTHPAHPKYHDQARFHEAGYDSLLTATILLRLAAKVHADRQQQQDSDSESFRSALSQLNNPDVQNKASATGNSQDRVQRSPQELVAVKHQPSNTKRTKTKGLKPSSNPAPSTRFQTRNIFEQLSLDSQDASSSEEEHIDVEATGWQDEVDLIDSSSWVPLETRERKPMEMIPGWDADFWQEFGNTLRVYGTQEAVLKIASWVDE